MSIVSPSSYSSLLSSFQLTAASKSTLSLSRYFPAMEFQTPPRTTTKENPPPPSPLSSAAATNVRLWRPAAQRNLRNQWSKLASLRNDWGSSSSAGRAHATDLVNSYLSQKHMNDMELGVLSDMENIRKMASLKLFKQQELQRNKLLSSYKDLVGIVTQMINASRSMRCYVKGTTNSPLAQFSSSAEVQDDSGDAGGVPVFTFFPMSQYEKLADGFVGMFISELNMKRLLLMELLSLGDDDVSETDRLNWSDEFYVGEFNDLALCSLYSDKDGGEPVLPSFEGCNARNSLEVERKQDRDVLQVYLTTWIAEVNIERSRVEEALALVGAEMHVNFS